jgi:hypothetical protein
LLGLAAPVLIYLGLGERFRESLPVSPMDMVVGDDLILGWDWISSHDPSLCRRPRQPPVRARAWRCSVTALCFTSRPSAWRTRSFTWPAPMTRHLQRSRPSTPTCWVALPRALPPDRGMELELETGDAPMPRSRPVKRHSEGGLAELRTQPVDLLDRGWIQHSTAGSCGVRAHAERVVAHLLRLPGPQRHHAPGCRAAPAHRRAA